MITGRQQAGGHQEVSRPAELGRRPLGRDQPLLLGRQGPAVKLPLGLGIGKRQGGLFCPRPAPHVLLDDSAVLVSPAEVEVPPGAPPFPSHRVLCYKNSLALFLQNTARPFIDLCQDAAWRGGGGCCSIRNPEMAHEQRLYRYRPLSNDLDLERLRQILCDHKVWYSAPNDFNDPFDCRFCVSMDGCPAEDHLHSDPKRAKEFAEDWLRSDAAKNHAVLTLSEVPDNILMWAHYGSAHTGVCLELTVPHDNDLHRVQYRDERPVFYYADVNESRRDVARFAASVIDTLTVKSRDWEYEREWRCIEFSGRGLKPLPERMLTGLIFGCRTAETHKQKIREWLAQRGHPVKLRQAREKVDRYGLDLLEL